VFKVERDREAFIEAVARRGVLVVAYPHGQVRAVTHYGVDAADIEVAIAAIRAGLAETARQPGATADAPAASFAG